MTVGDLELLLRETDYNGFPVVVNEENYSLVGFCTRFVHFIFICLFIFFFVVLKLYAELSLICCLQRSK